MAKPRILRIYLQPDQLKWARDGGFGVVNRIKNAFEWEGYRVELTRDSEEERLKSIGRRGYALYIMQEPNHSRALNLRRAYYYPFWRIEATNRRWDFTVAKNEFLMAGLDTHQTKAWANRWRKWIFQTTLEKSSHEGFVYVPLQGRLLEHRSFQTMSPSKMIEQVFTHSGNRRVVLGLHPGEQYSSDEISAIEALVASNPAAQMQMGGADDLVKSCDYIVTQNSAVALAGYFFHKPAILFGKIDFHHIGLNTETLGPQECFARVRGHRPDFDSYLHWFIQHNSIKADDENAGDQIVSRVRALGWEL